MFAAFAIAFVAGGALAQQSLGWSQLPGAAVDVGVGANGTAWAIGTTPEVGGYAIYRWNGSNWGKIPGSALRIDVDPQGNAWVVTSSHAIFRYNGSAFVQVPGAANDIGIGADGSVWVIGNDAAGKDYGIYRWTGSTWTKMPGAAVRIDVDPKGNPWVVNSGHQIFRWNGSGWTQMPGAAVDIGIGSDGSVFCVGPNGAVWKFNGSDWTPQDGTLTNISVDNRGLPWGVNGPRQIWRASGVAALRAREYLAAGDSLAIGEALESPSKTYLAVQQGDGNLCIYKGKTTQYGGNAVWCHNVMGTGGQFFTMLHADGNLCTYRGTRNAGGTTWCTNAVAKGGYFRVQQQDNGDLCVLHDADLNVPGASTIQTQVPMWCALSGKIPATVQIGDHRNAHLFDVYNASSSSVWITVYGASYRPEIAASGCLEPGQKGEVLMSGYGNADVRGELTRGAHCQQPVACNTDVQDQEVNTGWRSLIFKAAGNGCWWDFK